MENSNFDKVIDGLNGLNISEKTRKSTEKVLLAYKPILGDPDLREHIEITADHLSKSFPIFGRPRATVAIATCMSVDLFMIRKGRFVIPESVKDGEETESLRKTREECSRRGTPVEDSQAELMMTYDKVLNDEERKCLFMHRIHEALDEFPLIGRPKFPHILAMAMVTESLLVGYGLLEVPEDAKGA